MLVALRIWERRDQHSPGSLPPARSVEKRAWLRDWCFCSQKVSMLSMDITFTSKVIFDLPDRKIYCHIPLNTLALVSQLSQQNR